MSRLKGRRLMKKLLGLSVVLMIAPLAHAADVEAGKAKVATVCAACHGASGVSVSDTIPNLAAQRAGYLEAQLKALKDGTDMLPNVVWINATVTTEKQHRPGVNQAECFACHKPLDSTSYVFTLKQ